MYLILFKATPPHIYVGALQFICKKPSYGKNFYLN